MRERYLALLEELRDFHTTFTKEDELILRARFLRVIQDYYNVDESYDTPEDDDMFDEMVDNSDYKRVERVGRALDWKYRDCSNTISHQDVLTTMMYCFESCIKSHKSSGVVEAYVSTGGVTIKTNSVLHSIEVSFDVFQYTVNDEDDTFAEPEPDYPTKEKSEEDKGSGIDFYQDYYKGDPYAIGADYPTKEKSDEDRGEDPDCYRGYAIDPNSLR